MLIISPNSYGVREKKKINVIFYDSNKIIALSSVNLLIATHIQYLHYEFNKTIHSCICSAQWNWKLFIFNIHIASPSSFHRAMCIKFNDKMIISTNQSARAHIVSKRPSRAIIKPEPYSDDQRNRRLNTNTHVIPANQWLFAWLNFEPLGSVPLFVAVRKICFLLLLVFFSFYLAKRFERKAIAWFLVVAVTENVLFKQEYKYEEPGQRARARGQHSNNI